MVDFVNGGDIYFKCIGCGRIVNTGSFDIRCCNLCASSYYMRLSTEFLKRFICLSKKTISSIKLKEEQDV